MSYEPDSLELQFAVAELQTQLERPLRALATLNRLETQLPPDETPEHLLVLKGIALRNVGRHDEAVVSLQRALARGSENPSIYILLAEAQLDAGQSAQARQTLAQVAPLATARDQPRISRIASRIATGTTMRR